MQEAMSTPGEQEGRVVHLRLAQRGPARGPRGQSEDATVQGLVK
jgi:hypothetical protein